VKHWLMCRTAERRGEPVTRAWPKGRIVYCFGEEVVVLKMSIVTRRRRMRSVGVRWKLRGWRRGTC